MSVSPQVVSRLLANAGVPTINWSDKFKTPGVSVQRAPFGEALIYVDIDSKAERVNVEASIISLLVRRGYTVTGSNGILRIKHADT